MPISEVVNLGLARPRAEETNVAMTYMDPAMKTGALAMGNRAMIPPVSDLVAKSTNLPCRTIFIGMFCIVHSTLAAIELCKLHQWLSSGLLPWCRPHRHFVEGWPLHSC